jgi:hypothetical protein
MKLRIKFGLIDSREVSWWKTLHEFPNIIKFLGRNYEWIVYEEDPIKRVDYILTYSELPTYDPNYNVECSTWNELFGDTWNACECGAKFTTFPEAHMFYCRRWTKW